MSKQVVIVKAATDTEPEEVVKTSDVTTWSERQIEKLIEGISINLNHEAYFVEERET